MRQGIVEFAQEGLNRKLQMEVLWKESSSDFDVAIMHTCLLVGLYWSS